MRHTYTRISEKDLPSNLRWDTPRRFQGQIEATRFAEPGSPYEADDGALYASYADETQQARRYYRHSETCAYCARFAD